VSFGGRHAVQFYSASETADAAGSETVAYTFEFTAMVDFRVERVKKSDDGEIRQSGQLTALVRMPFTESIGFDWRVRYRDVYYDIEQIRDSNGLRRDLELTVVAVER
jgi:SPP1 family predicted phage head-tail adaptor